MKEHTVLVTLNILVLVYNVEGPCYFIKPELPDSTVISQVSCFLLFYTP